MDDLSRDWVEKAASSKIAEADSAGWGDNRPGSPLQVASLIAVRHLELSSYVSDESVQTDAFAFQLTDDPQKDETYVGGKPYRFKNDPWPTDENKSPLTFIGQLSLTRSKDLFRQRVDDVYSVYCKVDFHDFGNTEKAYVVEKRQAQDMNYVLHDLPDLHQRITCCRGLRYRTADFRHKAAFFQDDDALDFFSAFQFPGTKVGGLMTYRYDIPNDWPVACQNAAQFTKKHAETSGLDWTYLGTIASVQTAAAKSFSNNADDTYKEVRLSDPLILGDAGCIHLCLNAEDEVQLAFQW